MAARAGTGCLIARCLSEVANSGAPMRFVISVVCLALSAGTVLAQSGGGGSSGGGASSGGASRGGGAASAPSGSAVPSVGSPMSPGAAAVPRSPAPGDANPPSQRLPGTTANAPNGSLQPGARSPTMPGSTPYSGGARADLGGASSSPNSATAKNAAKAAVGDCMGLWDKGTHMTKAEWLATCRRIQGRLDSLKVDTAEPQSPAKPRSAGADAGRGG
jgi:hypothetical protein